MAARVRVEATPPGPRAGWISRVRARRAYLFGLRRSRLGNRIDAQMGEQSEALCRSGSLGALPADRFASVLSYVRRDDVRAPSAFDRQDHQEPDRSHFLAHHL